MIFNPVILLTKLEEYFDALRLTKLLFTFSSTISALWGLNDPALTIIPPMSIAKVLSQSSKISLSPRKTCAAGAEGEGPDVVGEAGEESVLELEESESTSGGAGAETDLLIEMLSR